MGDRISFRSAKDEARKYACDRARTGRLVEDVLTKAYRNRGWLQKIWDDLLTLCRLIRAWSRGEYKRLPWKSLILALAAIIYFLNPVDISPDMIPGIGFVDDAAMIALVLNSIRGDLRRFLEWEVSRKTTP